MSTSRIALGDALLHGDINAFLRYLWFRWLAHNPGVDGAYQHERDGADQDYNRVPPLTPGLGSKSRSPQQDQRVSRANRSVVENFSAIRGRGA